MDLIPEELLQLHEDEKVVFFCGAGVSISAGLPSFKKLVESTLTELLPPKDQCESGSIESLAWQAFEDNKYDAALGFLESPQHGGYEANQVREKICNYLTKPQTKTLDKHLILTRLADLDTNRGRLVTTNFDSLFQKAQKSDYKMAVHTAPTLPPAKPETFLGLVHLHGQLGDSPNNQQLVLTTADFGTAYMLEGWALRFVIDLFRHYHVVFIGYSLEDPTMRYLVQALAVACKESLQQFKEPYVFAPYSNEEAADLGKVEQQWKLRGITPLLYDKVEQQWKLRGITPLLYDKADQHRELWRTLEGWANDHRQGITGRRKLVTRLSQLPLVDENNSTIRKMAWALKDISVSKHFADLTGKHRPTSQWIMPLQKQGLLSLPADQTDNGQPIDVPLVSFQKLPDHYRLNKVTSNLGSWIAKCLDSQETLNWALSEGAVLHTQFRQEIQKQLGSNSTIDCSAFHKIWRLLADRGYAHMLSERYANRRGIVTYPGLAPDATFALQIFLNRLRPIPIFKVRSYLWDKQNPDSIRPSDLCDIKIELIGINGNADIQQFREKAEDWNGALAVIADDLTTHLREAMDWLCEFGLANQDEDITRIEFRSISPHEQNKYAPTWTQLISLARDSYDALVVRGDHAAATRLVQRWLSFPYPVFRRLALNVATASSNLDAELGLRILIQPTLWNLTIKRETLRFLRKRGGDLQIEQLTRLTEAILKGPPREMYRNDLKEDRWNTVRDRQIRLRLYKLMESGVSLSVLASEAYDRIQGDQPWQPRGDHSEEFSLFTSSDTAVLDLVDEGKLEDFGKMSGEQFIQWSQAQKGDGIHPRQCSGGWSQFVEDNTQAAVKLLKDAAGKKVWSDLPWLPVLDALEQNKHHANGLKQRVAELLADMPIQELGKLAHQTARWLENLWPQLSETARRKLWRKIRDASSEDEASAHNLDFQSTCNHAGGILGNVLYNELSEHIPEITPGQNPGFPEQLKQDFEYLTECENPSAKLTRVRLAPMLFSLYRINPDWTKNTFFRRMNPDKEIEFDQYLWEGYFWYAYCSDDLLAAFKPLLLKVLRHLGSIPEHSHDNAVTLFTYLAVPPDRGITTDEAKSVLWKLGPDKLVSVATTLDTMLQDAGEKSLALWRDTIGPWFEKAWPKRPLDRSPDLSESLALMAIESGKAFLLVVDAIKEVISEESYNIALLKLLEKQEDINLVSSYPRETFILIKKLFHLGSREEYLKKLLDVISKADPELAKEDSFKEFSGRL